MARKMVNCREVSNGSNCALTIAGAEGELLDAATAPAATKHDHGDTPERRHIGAGLENAEPVPA